MPSNYLIAPIPTGELGLNGSQNLASIPLGALTIANNISYSEGGFVKEGGSALYNTTAATGTIIDGYDWNPSTSLQRQIISVGGHIMRSTGAGTGTTAATGVFSDIATGLDTGVTETIFVEGGAESLGQNKKLFIFNGMNSPRIIDGDATSLATLTTPASDWSDTASGAPVWGAMHFNRVWVGGNSNDPHRAYYSTASNHQVFTGATGAGTFSVYPGEGEKLVAAVSFKGFLFLFKNPVGIYYIDSTDPSITNWRVERMSNTIGVAGSQALCIVENDIIFLDASGQFQRVSGVTQESRETSNISADQEIGQWVRDNVNLAMLSKAKMVYYPNKREVHCSIAGFGSTVNNMRIILDFNNPGFIRFRHSDKDECEALWMKKDGIGIERPVVGTTSGYVYELDQETNNVGGNGYSGKARTPYSDFSQLDPQLGVVRKNLHWLEMVVNPTGNFDLNVGVYIDGNLSETVTFNMGSSGAALGNFELDSDTLGGDQVLNQKRRIHGSGRRVSFEIENSGVDEDFNISKMYCHFKVGNNKLVG